MKTITVLLVSSVLLNVLLLYHTFDMAISLDYSRAAQKSHRQNSLDAIEIANEFAVNEEMSADKVKEIASTFNERGKLVKSCPGELSINQIIIKYDKD